tara:strand:- start:196 stop:429 length:234 start_codon:yes stop_codon:yes gene_type:complete
LVSKPPGCGRKFPNLSEKICLRYQAKIITLQAGDHEMEQKEDEEKNSDSIADSISAILIILIPVVAIIYWLSGLPTS